MTTHQGTGFGLCGCPWPPHGHQDGCRWQLNPDHRVMLAAATAVDPFPAPRLAPDDECEVLAQVHEDREYAVRVHHWIASRRAG